MFRKVLRRTAAFKALRGAVLCAALSASSSVVRAHQVWIEPDGKGMKLCFGEFADNQREVSPGYLDKLAQPKAHRVSAQNEIELPSEKGKNGFHFPWRPQKGESVIAADLAYPLIEGKDGDKPLRTAWTPAARYVTELAPQPAKLALDVLPTGQPGEFQVLYRGKPLADADATLVAASGWSRAGRTSSEGKVTFTLPWKGAYSLLVRHKDPTPGKRKSGAGVEEAYDVASFATTLTFETKSGLPSPPPLPAAPPNPMK